MKSVKKVKPQPAASAAAHKIKPVPQRKAVAGTPDVPIASEPQSRPERRWWWVCGLAVGLLLFAATATLARRHSLDGLNLQLFRHLNDLPQRLRPLFIILTLAPSSLWIGAAVVLMTFLAKLYQLAWQLAAAVLVGGGAALLAKHLIADPRPASLVNGVHLRWIETDPSFPSGHVLMVTVVVLSLWLYLPRGWRWAAATLIPTVGVARIYLGVHTPLDVIGGFALGLSVVSALRALPEPVRKLFRLD